MIRAESKSTYRSNVVGIVQARMSSSRLPGKALKLILGRPMLALQLERLQRCTMLDRLVVATSDQSDDDAVADLCETEGVACYRGSLSDVLDRFYFCATEFEAEHVVRLTGDCPLIDPAFIDVLVKFYMNEGADYASYCRPPSLPDGLDAEIFTFDALEAAWREASDCYEREHVVPFIVRRPERFRLVNWVYRENLSHMRWTVDEPQDLMFIMQIFKELYPVDSAFAMGDVLNLLKRKPELLEINAMYPRKPGCETSAPLKGPQSGHN